MDSKYGITYRAGEAPKIPGFHPSLLSAIVRFRHAPRQLFFGVLTWVCLTTAALQGATYYVSKSGSDSNSGTNESSPFLTVQKGVNSALAGDTVRVGQGVFAENVITTRAGSSGSPIVVNGQNVATIGSLGLSHSNIHILNFTISGGTNLWKGLLYMERTGSRCVISNNTFNINYNTALNPIVRWNGPSAAPYGTAGSGNLFVSNTFNNARCEKLFSVYGDTNVFYGNKMLDCDATDFMQVFGRSNYIVANLISNVFDSGLFTNHTDFIQTFGLNFGSQGHVIERNSVIAMHGLAQIGNLVVGTGGYECRDMTFKNNLFVGVSAKISCAMPEVKFYNNLFYHCATNTVNGGNVLIYTDSGTLGQGHSGKVFNNVFLDCGYPGAKNSGWYQIDTTLTNISADYNYVGKLGYKAVSVDTLHRPKGDPGGWDKYLWWEPNGINGGDPLFVSESQLDFRLQAGSSLIGTALPLNQFFTRDLRGNLRGLQWDIGALEFQTGEIISPSSPFGLHVLSP